MRLQELVWYRQVAPKDLCEHPLESHACDQLYAVCGSAYRHWLGVRATTKDRPDQFRLLRTDSRATILLEPQLPLC